MFWQLLADQLIVGAQLIVGECVSRHLASSQDCCSFPDHGCCFLLAPPPQIQPITNRATADKLFKTANRLYDSAGILVIAAQQDLKQHDRAGYDAKMEEVRNLRAQAGAAIDEAQRIAWSANNARSTVWDVDLHGLSVSRAIAQFAKQFKGLQSMEHPGGVLFRVIVGQGKHSEDKVPKIKLGILKYLQEEQEMVEGTTGKPWGITWEVDPTNPGVINVRLPADDVVLEDDDEEEDKEE